MGQCGLASHGYSHCYKLMKVVSSLNSLKEMISGIKVRHWMKFTGYKSNTDKNRDFLAQHNTHVGCGAPPAAGHPGC